MSEAVNPLAWIECAEEDYTIARSALRRKTPLVYPACFHAQQCAEKYLKAVLLANSIPFPKSHDLLMLTSLIEEAGILVPVEKKALNSLNDYSVRVRYPGDSPSVDEGREAQQIAKSVRRFVRKLFGL